MQYLRIDPTIDAWAKRHKLHIGTVFKEVEVRSTDVVSQAGERFQIWIDVPVDEIVGVHAWDYSKTSRDWEVPIDQLGEALDDAVRVVNTWMKPPH